MLIECKVLTHCHCSFISKFGKQKRSSHALMVLVKTKISVQKQQEQSVERADGRSERGERSILALLQKKKSWGSFLRSLVEADTSLRVLFVVYPTVALLSRLMMATALFFPRLALTLSTGCLTMLMWTGFQSAPCRSKSGKLKWRTQAPAPVAAPASTWLTNAATLLRDCNTVVKNASNDAVC